MYKNLITYTLALYLLKQNFNQDGTQYQYSSKIILIIFPKSFIGKKCISEIKGIIRVNINIKGNNF